MTCKLSQVYLFSKPLSYLLLFHLLTTQELVIVLTGIHIYSVHFSMLTLFVRHVPARARSFSYLELILMYLYNDYSNVNTASGS